VGIALRMTAKTEIVLVNSAAGFILGEKAEKFETGMELALESIRSGCSMQKT